MNIETFKSYKSKDKKSKDKQNKKQKNKDKKNKYYGVKNSGDTGKNFYNRSFGGAMSNRKYTKEQVKPHKLDNKTPTIKNQTENVIPPLYPVTLSSSSDYYRTGYVNNKDTIDAPNDITKYYYPSQELKDINVDTQPKSITITNVNNNRDTNDNANSNTNANGGSGDYGGWNNGWWNNNYPNGYNWFYNTLLYPWNIPPYPYYGYPPNDDNNKTIIINNKNDDSKNNIDDENKNTENFKVIIDRYHKTFLLFVALVILIVLLLL